MDRLHIRTLIDGTDSAFWVESTAPLNVEDKFDFEKDPGQPGFSRSEENGIELIVNALERNSELLISVHGFNVTRDAAKELYTSVQKELQGFGPAYTNCVFIGYRWPSERMFSNLKSSINAIPPTIGGLILFATSCFVPFILLSKLLPQFLTFFTIILLLGGIIISLILTLFLLRSLVYFRDIYRATNYGVPDLVYLIRRLEHEIQGRGVAKDRRRIKLSFIGHSMGAFVVTTAVRLIAEILAPWKQKRGVITKHFELGRLVVVSPDIPVESIIPRRLNFLELPLAQFQELYLFSNQGDIVLKMVSTIANYFFFPSRFWANGYRLGNMEVRHQYKGQDPTFGIINLSQPINGQDDFLGRLRLGWFTLLQRRDPFPTRKWHWDFFAKLEKTDPSNNVINPQHQKNLPLAMRFSYFDCTDYTETRPMLTWAKKKAELSVLDNWRLLLAFLIGIRKVDVHSGYFSGAFTLNLICGLAGLGWVTYLHSIGSKSLQTEPLSVLEQISQKCVHKQIRVLLSPERINQLHQVGSESITAEEGK